MSKKVVLKFIDHEINKDLYVSKKALYNEFMGGFYDFLSCEIIGELIHPFIND